jgi:anti-sigma factor RsiW
MIDERLEFAISQYLDGDLPPQERAALEQRLAADPAARQLLEQYRSLNNAMRSAARLPPVNWQRLAQAISGAVAQQPASAHPAASDQHITDDLELAITRYVDGELPDEQGPALQRRLASDPAAAGLLAQHRSLDAMLKHAWPLPHVDWDRLGQHLSHTVTDELAPSRYSIRSWLRYASPVVAAAACLLIAISLVWHLAPRRPVIDVIVAAPEPPGGPALVLVDFGPPDDLALSPFYQYASGVVAIPARVQIAGNLPPRATDSSDLPF